MKYNFCKNCGSPVQPGMPNCQRCGAPVDQIQPVDENKPMAQPPGMLRQYYGDNNGNNQPNSNVAQPVPQGQPMNQPMEQQPVGNQPVGNQPPMGQPMGQPMPGQQPMYNQPAPQPNVNDSGSIGWGILGFLIPIIGLILYCVWKNTKPKSAKVAGIGALIGFCLNMVLYFTGAVNINV